MAAPATVIPLRANGKTVEVRLSAPELPEPMRLYGLTVLAFLLHVPAGIGGDRYCARCPELWPREHLRLAFRLREAFQP
jgi:hypothetical protein